MKIIEGESDIELLGDEEEERQAVEQDIEYSEEDLSAEEEPEEEIIDTQHPICIRSDTLWSFSYLVQIQGSLNWVYFSCTHAHMHTHYV